jgi:hypothetical protein
MRSDYFSQRLVPSLEYPVLPSLLEDHERDQRFSIYYFSQLMQETNSMDQPFPGMDQMRITLF